MIPETKFSATPMQSSNANFWGDIKKILKKSWILFSSLLRPSGSLLVLELGLRLEESRGLPPSGAILMPVWTMLVYIMLSQFISHCNKRTFLISQLRWDAITSRSFLHFYRTLWDHSAKKKQSNYITFDACSLGMLVYGDGTRTVR